MRLRRARTLRDLWRNASPALFAQAFALALIAHQLWWGGFTVLHPHGLVVLVALWVLARPSSAQRLKALFAAEALSVALDLSTVGDHTLIAFFVCLVGLAAPPAALQAFIRATTVLLYGAAALSKLNGGFLDPAVSCAGPLARDLVDASWVTTPAIAGTVAVEVALALLLAIPRTRRAGVLLGCGFHAVLALAGNVPFAALALALYAAFLHRPAGSDAEGRPSPARAWRRAILPVGSALYLLGATTDPGTRPALELATLAGTVAFSVIAVRSSGAPRSAARLHPIAAAALAILVVNAASPYVGLRTEATFTMFSNLQTEPGHWNHRIVPEQVRVFGLQDDLVPVPGTDRLRVRQEQERVLRQRNDPEAPPRPWYEPLLNFYDVRPGARGRC